jgi:phage shock protein PspC (stress-responsive transcriptional regulator)
MTESTLATGPEGAPAAHTAQNGGGQAASEPTRTTTAVRSILYRHPTDKILGGVCGGLADYLHWDATLVRILWVVATISTGGGGLLAYLALWMLLPVGTVQNGQTRPAAIELNERSLNVAAKVLIALGVLLLLSNLGVLPSLWSGFWTIMNLLFWPALLIGIGYLLLRGTGGASAGALWERINLNGWSGAQRPRMHVPTRDEVKGGLRNIRQRLPLKRSRRDRMFMGVCGGIGQKLGIDANLVRLIWAAFSIGSIGMGVLIYILAGLLLPEEAPAELSTNGANTQDVQVIDGAAVYKL